MNDQKIIELFWERHESAISVTAEKYGKYCHTIAYNILFNHFDAEECVNEYLPWRLEQYPPAKARQPDGVSRKNRPQPRHQSL